MSKLLCAAPWKSLHIQPTGEIRTCCAGAPIGNIKHNTVKEVIFGDKLKEVRQSIKDGKLHEEYCKYCIEIEEGGQESERSWHNNVAGDFELPEDYLNYYEINLLDVRWNITCNMSCNYCGPFASSKWMKLIDGTEINPPSKQIDSVLEFIEEHKQHIKSVNLIGGEPLLLRDNIRLLSILDKNTQIGLISNLNVDLETNKVYEELKNFNSVHWSISFENVGEEFEYVRYGGRWELMQHNLAELRKHNNFTIILAPVYNLYTATKLVPFYDWVLANKFEVKWSYLIEPPELAVKNQSKISQLAIDDINAVLKDVSIPASERAFLEQMVNILQDATQDLSAEFLNTFSTNIENKYHPDKKGEFKRLWSSLYAGLIKF